MLKKISLMIAFSISSLAYADCEISDALKNKSCSSDYFLAKNQKQLNEYLRYGKFKDGKLLNIEIGFDIREKEINIGTSCDIRLKHDADMRAHQNGICLQGNNVFIRKQSSLFADSKAPINIIANNSIKVRKTRIQTGGEVNIIAKAFDPFANEILISKDSYISSEKLTISTPSSLIINDDSRIRSSSVILNGGNCEVGDNDDQDNDDTRNRERFCKRFTPKFTYTGTCLNNPIPTNLKISSVADKSDSLKMTYSVPGVSSGLSVKWKFDDEFQSSNTVTVQHFVFPGRHLSEAVVSNSNGFFRKKGAYQNVSPTKFNKGQIAIFQFNGLTNGPYKVLALMGLKKVTLIKSEQDPELYSGEIHSDSAGTKLIAIPEFRYKGSFNLVILPRISNPDSYINQSVDQLNALLDSVNSTNQSFQNSKASLQNLLEELKTKIAALPASDKQKIAEYLQSNIFADLQGITSFKQIKEKPSTLFGLLVASVYADDVINDIMTGIVTSLNNFANTVLRNTPLAIGGTLIFGGFIGIKYLPKNYQWIGFVGMAAGAIALIRMASAAQDEINNVHNIDPNSIYLKLPNQINSGENTNLTVWGQAVPLDSIAPTSPLISQAIDAKLSANTQLDKINSQVASVNSTLSFFGFSSQIEPLPFLIFPQTKFQTILSPNYITKVQLISSEDGQASIQSYSKNGNNLLITFKSSKTQNAKLRIHYVNTDMGITKDIDTTITIIADSPKAVISYTKNNLQVNFNSTGNTDLTGLSYAWNFGDTQTSGEKAPSHTYSQAGTYLVSLTVTDTYGGSSSITENVSVEKAATGDASVKLCMTDADTSKYDFNLYAIDATTEGDALVESFSFSFTKSLNSGGYPINKCLCKTVNLQTNLEYGLTIKGSSHDLGDKIYPYAEYLVPENSTIKFAVTYFRYPYQGYQYYIGDNSVWTCNE